ncbi:MAG: hypothetical protein OEZ10_11600 [Gammaproteobacteria bacterium]|nr:hypothetical protein [Gammaproteobacteria bacterium]
MGEKSDDQLPAAKFICSCGEKFEAAPTRVEPDESRPWHPWEYFGRCPECGDEAPQAHWQRNLLKGWASATGPKTPEGKASSAANLEGHPTPQEALITRFNRMTTGLHAKVARYFPAKPGKYDACNGCRYRRSLECFDEKVCLIRTELYMKHLAAFEQQDPSKLQRYNAELQATLRAIIDDMLLGIISKGVQIESPVYGFDKEGRLHIGEVTDPDTGAKEVLTELRAHPLLKPLMEFIGKNNLALGDMGMTAKVQDEQEITQGFLEHAENDRETMQQFLEHQTKGQQKLIELINRNTSPIKGDVIDAEVVRRE